MDSLSKQLSNRDMPKLKDRNSQRELMIRLTPCHSNFQYQAQFKNSLGNMDSNFIQCGSINVSNKSFKRRQDGCRMGYVSKSDMGFLDYSLARTTNTKSYLFAFNLEGRQ